MKTTKHNIIPFNKINNNVVVVIIFLMPEGVKNQRAKNKWDKKKVRMAIGLLCCLEKSRAKAQN